MNIFLFKKISQTLSRRCIRMEKLSWKMCFPHIIMYEKSWLKTKWRSGEKLQKKLPNNCSRWNLVRTNLILVRTRLLTSDQPGLIRSSLDTSLERTFVRTTYRTTYRTTDQLGSLEKLVWTKLVRTTKPVRTKSILNENTRSNDISNERPESL